MSIALESLLNKVTIVTGASSGIGKATALLFAKNGAKLAISGRNIDRLNEVKKQIQDQHKHEPLVIVGDLAEENTAQTIIDQTVSHYGRLDVLVNNAGILALGSIENTTVESFDNMMNVNLRSVFKLTKFAIPHLEKTKGNIVNISSVNGIRSFANVLSYCVSKAAVDQLTHCVALELAPKGIRVNAVNPGVILTELQKRGGLSDEVYTKFLEHSKTTHALGRVGNPEEVAAMIAFLASDAAAFITAASIPVDGGRHAMCPR